jgi:capsule biosynthesis phosphatase
MIVIITLGGIGIRFKKNGYSHPKGLINIFCKPMIYYLIEKLNLEKIKYVLIPYNSEYSKYYIELLLKKDFPNINFIFHMLEKNTLGAADTINIALKNVNLNKDMPILCLDCDSFYLCDIVSLWNGKNVIFTNEVYSNNLSYSYIKINNENIITDIKEKEKISNNGCVGAYGFASYKEFIKYSDYIILNNLKEKNEFYISTVIKYMINDIKMNIISIDNTEWLNLGTPELLRIFYNNYSGKNDITKKRICFDLDNTLVTYPYIQNDYNTVKPIKKNIDFLKYLKKYDNTIIIYTARRMKTHNGNLGKINADIGKITFDTLEKFDIPFDEIYFGKPYADFYIDDLAINSHDDIEKYLGYYTNEIKPRDFNKIYNDSIITIIKEGDNLLGEIYYYKNIPNDIKDMFPVMIDFDKNWYKIEKIFGITVSILYTSELLKENILDDIIDSINKLHSTEINICDNINIYRNYAEKLKNRYESYDYSNFKDSKIIFKKIYNDLKKYEEEDKGKKVIIHGDPVMTNILVNNFNKIKFIDMRGIIDNDLTIYGDYLYDWAKLYQSLIGYDYILQDKIKNEEYIDYLVNYFKNYFITKFSRDEFNLLKIITKSLLFSLIPLHNNDKCNDYFNLIHCVYLEYLF